MQKTRASRSPISMKYMNRLGYDFQHYKRSNSVKNLFEFKSINSYSTSNPTSRALSEDETTMSKASDDNDVNKNMNQNKICIEEDKDEDIVYELVINNDKEEENHNKSSSQNQNKTEEDEVIELSNKLIGYIKKKDLEKIKHFFAEHKLTKKNDDTFNNDNKGADYSGDEMESLETNLNIDSIQSEASDCSKKGIKICEKLDRNGWNSIHYATYYGFSEILSFMLNNLNIPIDLYINKM